MRNGAQPSITIQNNRIYLRADVFNQDAHVTSQNKFSLIQERKEKTGTSTVYIQVIDYGPYMYGGSYNHNNFVLSLKPVVVSDSDTTICPFDCNSRGTCQNNTCLCDGNYVGLACDITAQDITENGTWYSILHADETFAFFKAKRSVIASTHKLKISYRENAEQSNVVLLMIRNNNDANVIPSRYDYDKLYYVGSENQDLFMTDSRLDSYPDHYETYGFFQDNIIETSVEYSANFMDAEEYAEYLGNYFN